MNTFFKILNKLFFKTWIGILTIILNLLYIILLAFMFKGNLTQIVNAPLLMIISNSILLMPFFIIEIKKMSFIQKFFLIKKNKINNFLPILFFLIINIFFYFISIFLILMINIKEKKIIDVFFLL